MDVHDPWASQDEVRHEYGIEMLASPAKGHYEAVIIAVAHNEFRELGAEGIRAYTKPDGIVFDVKYALPADAVDERL